MKRIRRLLLLPALLSAAAFAAGASAQGIAIVGGTVHAMDGSEPLHDAKVLIADGRIEAVGADVPVPAAYQRIDAAGKIVTPGLIDSWTQIGLVEIEAESISSDIALEDYPLGPGLDVSYALNPHSSLIAINRMGGVLRAVAAPAPGVDPLAGLAAAVRLTERGFLTESRIALFGQLDGGSAGFTGGNRAAAWQRLHAAFAEAERFNPSRYRADPGDYSRHDMAALKRFLRSGRPLALDIDREADILRALELAEAHDLKLVLLGGGEAWKVRDALAAADAAVVVQALDNMPNSFGNLGARLDNAALLHEAGVDVLFTGPDTHRARAVRYLAGNAVANGLPWQAALAGLTSKAAAVWGMDDAGVIRPGAHADVVVWNGDPLEVTTWAEHVVAAGVERPLVSRQTQLFERYRDLGKPYGYR